MSPSFGERRQGERNYRKNSAHKVFERIRISFRVSGAQKIVNRFRLLADHHHRCFVQFTRCCAAVVRQLMGGIVPGQNVIELTPFS